MILPCHHVQLARETYFRGKRSPRLKIFFYSIPYLSFENLSEYGHTDTSFTLKLSDRNIYTKIIRCKICKI